VNECGQVVRTRAPLNAKNWQEAFTSASDGMWKEVLANLQRDILFCLYMHIRHCTNWLRHILGQI